MSPDGSEIANDGPSTSVTATASPRIVLAFIVHGWDTGGHATRHARAVRSYARRVKIAEIAPPWFTVPPSGYGGIELVVSLLTDRLVEHGHDVTLFASGGSHTKAE